MPEKKISVRVIPSLEHDNYTFTFEELDITEKEWNKLTDLEKEERVNKIVETLPEQPYWVVDKIK